MEVLAPAFNQCRWIVPNGGSNYCDLMIWYDYLQDLWGTTDISAIKGNFCANMHDTAKKIQFYVGGVYNVPATAGGGYVYQGDSGGTDNGTNITCEVVDRGHPAMQLSQMGVAMPAGNSENKKSFSHIFVFFKPTAGVALSIYGLLDDPDGTPQFLGTIDASRPSGQDHIHINVRCRRLYVRIVESSELQGLVIRGWQLYYKDIGQHNAP